MKFLDVGSCSTSYSRNGALLSRTTKMLSMDSFRMIEHDHEPLITSTVPSQGPSRGQTELRLYPAPPRIDTDFNARYADSSERDPQTRPPLALPFVQQDTPAPPPRSSFRTLQAWEGIVTAVEGQSFSVTLFDLSGNEPDEEAEIDLEDVSVDERDLIAIGAVFLLHVGYSTSEGGQRSRMSILRFRRLPVWTDEELESARRSAQERLDTIHWA